MSTSEQRRDEINSLYRQVKRGHVVRCPRCESFKTRLQHQPDLSDLIVAILIELLLVSSVFWSLGFVDDTLRFPIALIVAIFGVVVMARLWAVWLNHVQCERCGYKWKAPRPKWVKGLHIENPGQRVVNMGQHTMNIASKDLSDSLWTASAFVPIVVLYSLLIQYLDFTYEWLNSSFPLIEELDKFVGVFGISFITLGLIQKAAEYSENDFLSGPIQLFNLYSFFFLGLLVGGKSIGGLELAILTTAAYYILERFNLPVFSKNSISAEEWYKFQRSGVPRKHFVLSYYIMEPLVGVITMIVSYWILSQFIPVEVWLRSGWIFQVQFLTLQIVLWKQLESVVTVLYDKIVPNLNLGGMFWFLLAFVPAMALASTWPRILFYVAAYSVVWFALILFLVTMIKNGRVKTTLAKLGELPPEK